MTERERFEAWWKAVCSDRWLGQIVLVGGYPHMAWTAWRAAKADQVWEAIDAEIAKLKDGK